MIRKAFVMTLRPECEAEYERRHNPIWPELETVLKDHGVWTYSIFLNRENDQLFAFAEIESETTWQQIAETEICQKWWAHMKDLVLTNDDNSPIVIDLSEIFCLE